MTLMGGLQIGLFVCLLLALTKPVGAYLYSVFEGLSHFKILPAFGRKFFDLCGVSQEEQEWKTYACSCRPP